MKKFSLDHRLLENFSWPLLLSALALCGCGLINLYSVSDAVDFGGDWSWFVRQSLFLALALASLGAALLLDYQYLKKLVWLLYALNILSLAAVFFVGAKVNGATRWLDLGLFRFQPSESVKVVVVVALAAWFAKRDLSAGLGFRDLLAPFLLILLPFVLIHKQPDLGTAVHLAATCGPIFLIFRFRRRLVLAAALVLAVLIGLAGFMHFTGSWHLFLEKGLVKPHQIDRVKVYLNPGEHREAGGWQVGQSENAVGGGQITGRGFLKGPQHKNGFLPEADTDFAFAALAEEWGFLGAVTVLALFVCLLTHGLALARRSKDRFGSLIALGLTSLLFWQATINVGMVIGLFPVVGIPLPFISYGGTSLVVTLISVGLMLNIGMRRYLFQDEPVRANPQIWQRPAEEEIAAPPSAPIRRLALDTPFNPELHPRHRLPHVRPWARYLRKSRARGPRDWQAPDHFID